MYGINVFSLKRLIFQYKLYIYVLYCTKNIAVVIVVPRFSFSKVVVANRSYPFSFSVRISSYICYIGNTAVLVFRIAQLERKHHIP